MDEFLTSHHLFGIALGAAAFLIIGLFHPIVIKAEYYLGVKCWWGFVLLGVVCLALSVLVRSNFLSSIAGVAGFSSFWSILELFQQRQRVEKGWFPKKPQK